MGSGGIPPGRPVPGTGGAVNPALDQVIALVDWFGHPDNNIFDGMTPTSVPVILDNCNPAATMTALVSLKPTAPLAFLGLFLSAGAPHGLTRLLMFPWASPRLLDTPSPFNTGLCAHSDKVAGGLSPIFGFPDTAFNPHNNATMITIPDDPNRFIRALNTHGGTLLPLSASGTADAKDTIVSFMTWVPPCHMHLFLNHRLSPCAAAVAGVTVVENNGTHAQAQAFMD